MGLTGIREAREDEFPSQWGSSSILEGLALGNSRKPARTVPVPYTRVPSPLA